MNLVDISNAVILTPKNISNLEEKAVKILVEEIEKRTGIVLPVVHEWPRETKSLILVGSEEALMDFAAPYLKIIDELDKPGTEGYRILVSSEEFPIIFIIGKDSRGVIYGVGKFLRKILWKRGSLKISSKLKISSTPLYSLRGHQLGYRPKTNAYDAWSVEQFDQYIRELAIFGANSIEILPPRTDDEPINSLMKVPPLEMMIKLSQIISSYGLDVWIWYPNMFSNSDFKNEEVIKRELAEREEIFSKLPKIDAVFIPGGDPGELGANELFEWAKKVAEILSKYHPKAKIWLSPQFPEIPSDEWYEKFYENVRKEPEWLGGIVFGPRVKTPLQELRRIVPKKYPIRHYPDITHSIICQYPVPNWDLAFAITLGRECINPRPKAMKHIHNLFAQYAMGSICYSEGINDDVNKFIWLDQEWDPKTPVIETLRDYARFFICSEWADEIAHGILALEENWNGPLIANDNIEITLRQWQEMENSVPQTVLKNYRFQMCLLRAYYDAYIKRRLIYETELEKEAIEVLDSAEQLGSLKAIEKAEKILARAWEKPVARNYYEKCEELADELFRNIGAQLSVEKHQAASWERGAFMDDINMPLNNSKWLLAQFKVIRSIESEEERLKLIRNIVNRTNPGPGGFYDDFGNFRSLRHLPKQGKEWIDDPGYLLSTGITFATPLLHSEELERKYNGIPLAWIGNIASPFQVPLTVCYNNLDPDASYNVRVTYIGTFLYSSSEGKIKLIANESFVVHDFIDVFGKCVTLEFPVPQEAIYIGEGKLKLTWITTKGSRGVRVAELWIIKKKRNSYE